MKLIHCTNCGDVFKPTAKKKKCDCKLSSGYIADNTLYYGGVHAVALKFKDEWFEKGSPATDSESVPLLIKAAVASGPDRDLCIKVIEYINQVTGSSYSTKFPSTICTEILARKNEHNISFEDFKSVIDKKWAEWKGTDKEIYVRPSTLFRQSKFIIYLGQKNYVKQPGNSSQYSKFADTVRSAAEEANNARGSSQP